MELLNITFKYNPDSNSWDGYVKEYPQIHVCKACDLEQARDVMYHLITEEMFYLHNNLSSWAIESETVIYI